MVKIKKMPVKPGSSVNVNKKKRFGRFSIANFLIFLVLLLLVGFFIFNIGKSIYTSISLFYDNRRLEARIDELYYEKLVLLEEETGEISDSVIEKEAKSKLGLLRPGEELLILEDNNN